MTATTRSAGTPKRAGRPISPPGPPSIRERPILFSGEMVRAILDGRKSQTRRVLKSPIEATTNRVEWNTAVQAFRQWRPAWYTDGGGIVNGPDLICPYGQVGDRLWVRETLRHDTKLGSSRHGRPYWRFAADDTLLEFNVWDDRCHRFAQWTMRNENKAHCPSIHMPRWASRITLEITQVRVERIEDCSEEDAIAEGGFDEKENDGELPSQVFRRRWDALNAKRGFGWDANPWVWVLSFRRVEPQAVAA